VSHPFQVISENIFFEKEDGNLEIAENIKITISNKPDSEKE
jgi:hypothetical protein